MTRASERDEEREAHGVDTGGEGASGPRAHDAGNIAGGSGEREHQSRVRDSYDAVTDAYVNRVHDELDFRFFDLEWLAGEIAAAGFSVEARLVRAPYADIEVQTTRAYVLARRMGEAVSS